jgi:hypothetical protein
MIRIVIVFAYSRLKVVSVGPPVHFVFRYLSLKNNYFF